MLYNELSEGITHRGNFNPTVMVGITEMFEKTYDTEESNINSVYKADKNYTLIDSDDGKITWFASRLLACISKRYKGGKEFVKNTPTPRHETFRIYYKGDKGLFVAILPVALLIMMGLYIENNLLSYQVYHLLSILKCGKLK